MCTSTSLISQSHFTTKTMSERRNELSKSRWVPPTTTKESRLSPLCCQIWMIRVPRRKGRHTLLGSAWIIGIAPIQTNHLWALLTFDRTLALHIWKAVKRSNSWFTSHLHMEIYYPPSTFPAFWSRVPHQLLNNISSTNSPQQKHEQQLKNDLHSHSISLYQKVKQI